MSHCLSRPSFSSSVPSLVLPCFILPLDLLLLLLLFHLLHLLLLAVFRLRAAINVSRELTK